jgi:uncharacterized protein YegP (UPF0339 family)
MNYEVKKDSTGEWRWQVKAANHEIIAASTEGYKNKADAEQNFQTVITLSKHFGTVKRTGLNFGEALEALKNGQEVARKGWNGKGMFIFLMKNPLFPMHQIDSPSFKRDNPDRKFCATKNFLAMRDAQGEIVPGWLASQTDMLADDWMIVE